MQMVFKISVVVMPIPSAKNNECIPSSGVAVMIIRIVIILLIRKYIKVCFSLPMLFSIDVVMPLIPVGIIVHAAYFRYIPASILSNKNWHSGSANEISGGRHIKEQHIVNRIDELICFFNDEELPDCIMVAISGISAIDNEPIRVEGIVSIGKAMPMAIPSILSA